MIEYFWPKSPGPSLAANCTLTGAGSVGDALAVGGGRPGPPTHTDGSYLTTLNGNSYGAWMGQSNITMDWPPTYSINSITSMTIGARQWRDGGSGSGAAVLMAFALTSAAEADFSLGPNNQWNTFTQGHARSGGSWLVSDLTDANTFYFRTNSTFPNGDFVRFASIFGNLDYVPRYGGFFAILGFAALAVLPFQSDFNRLLDYKQLHEARRPTLTEPEREQAWREYRAFTNPKHFVLGKEV